jgi:preprotein translocase subunit SecD
MNFRLIIFLVTVVFGVFFSIPSFLQLEKGAKVNLGLDLQGGLHMLLGVKTDEAIKSKTKSIASSIKYFCDDEDLVIDNLKVKDNQVSLELLDSSMKQKLDEELKKMQGLKIDSSKKGDTIIYNISMTPKEIESVKSYAVTQAVDTIRNRLDMSGTVEPTVAKQGKENILVEIPGVKTPEDEKRIRGIISKAAHLQLMAVDEDRADQVNSMSEAEAREYGDVILQDQQGRKYMVKEIPILDGSMLTDARVAFSQSNQPIINFTLNSAGARIFGDFSGKSVGKRLAVVLDDIVYSAPVIRERIGGGSGQISGNFSVQEAHDVAIALRSGALLAPVALLEKRSVGPSLGADSIKQSMIALVSGFFAVFFFMIFYYRKSGIISDIALLANLFLLIAVMALFGATLTLPGMAGIVLTVGMAVDANVIILERIRELLKEGKNVAYAIEHGYSNAMTAILDANITTLIAAVVLYAYGTGPIKGFAITISIGILASMITAILGTHGVYQYLLSKNAINKSDISKWFGIKVEGK